MRLRRTSGAVSVCWPAAALLIATAQAAPDLFDGFAPGWRERWRQESFFTKPTVYDVATDAGRPVLHAMSRAAHAGLVRRVEITAPAVAQLSWRWKVRRALANEKDERMRAGDDYAARVFVVFEESVVPLRTRALNYVWAAREPMGAFFPSPYSKNVGMCVVRSGDADAGAWREESRDVLADYRKFFGEPPSRISAVAVLVDTDNTGLEAEAWFADLRLEDHAAPVAPAVGAVFDHVLFSQILAAHVKDGRVDYAALKTDARLPRYLAQLAAAEPEKLATPAAQLALWLNAYNAYTLKLILDRAPAKSITEIGSGGLVLGTLLKTTAWDIRFAEVGGKKYTLNEIEHEIVRRKFSDARAHFALNCASGSCPILRSEAYEPGKLDVQLDEQARQFLGDNARNRFDLATKTAELSAIFSWYQKDFGADERAMLLAAAKFAPDDVRRAIEAEPAAWTVKHLAYDWSLNTANR